MFRFAAVAALAASSVVASEIAGVDLGLAPGADAGVEINSNPDVDTFVKLPGLVDSHSQIGVSKMARAHRQRRQDLSQLLGPLSSVFTDLQTSLAPVLSTVTGLVGDVESVPSDLESQLTSALGSVTSLLGAGGANLTTVTSTVGNLVGDVTAPTEQAVANTISGVYTGVAQALSTVQQAESSLPVVGPILSKATGDIESQLSSITGTLGTVAAPLLSTLSSVLSPVEGLLGDVGLGSVTDLLSGLL